MSKDEAGTDYRSIFNSLPGRFIVVDLDFNIVAVSDEFLKATLSDRNDIMGRYAFSIYTNNPDNPSMDSVSKIIESLNKVLATKACNTLPIQQHDLHLPESQGGGFEERYWSIIQCPVLSKDNTVKYIIHRTEDVSEYVKMKQKGSTQSKIMKELHSRAGEMEKEIYKRTQETQVINNQLHEAYSRLSHLNELKTKFFANVSHELRTPLMLILGPLDMLSADKSLSSEQLNTIKLVERNAHIVLKHVNNLLDIAKLDAMKLTLHYVNIDLVKLIKQVVELFKQHNSDDKLHFSLSLPKTLNVQVDPDKIERILVNLLSNACKFAPKKSVIKITLKTLNKRAHLSIQDEGAGIPPDIFESIFERFFQVEESTTRSMGGTGLGLAIVKEFIELHGGSITACNAKKGGALFTLNFPIQAPAKATVSSDNTLIDGAYNNVVLELETNKTNQKSLRDTGSKNNSEIEDLPLVLIVEDNVDMNQFLTKLLTTQYRVEKAFNGNDGLQKALHTHPDLIITDIMMPHMSGTQLVHELRKHSELLATPILILTAKADDDLCVRMLQEGAQDYMIKPFLPKELTARVANLIKMKKVEDELNRFVYLATHDLKAPLPAMEHLISWIEEDAGENLKEQSKKHLKLLRGRAQRMAGLLDGLLKYSHAGQANNDCREIDIKQLVQSIVKELNPPKSFSFKYANNLPVLKSSALSLHEVFTTFISNSIKHHSSNNGHVEIGVRDKANFYEFFITDDGPGIEPEYQRKVFDLYQTLQARDILESSGVGLSVAKRLFLKNIVIIEKT